METLKVLIRTSEEMHTIKATLKVNYANPDFPDTNFGYDDSRSVLWNLVSILDKLTNHSSTKPN